MVLFAGGGLIPPVLRVVAGILGKCARQKGSEYPHIMKHKAYRVELIYIRNTHSQAAF